MLKEQQQLIQPFATPDNSTPLSGRMAINQKFEPLVDNRVYENFFCSKAKGDTQSGGCGKRFAQKTDKIFLVQIFCTAALW
jgi:hypothetical protein